MPPNVNRPTVAFIHNACVVFPRTLPLSVFRPRKGKSSQIYCVDGCVTAKKSQKAMGDLFVYVVPKVKNGGSCVHKAI